MSYLLMVCWTPQHWLKFKLTFWNFETSLSMSTCPNNSTIENGLVLPDLSQLERHHPGWFWQNKRQGLKKCCLLKANNKMGWAGSHSRFPLGFPMNFPSESHQKLNLYKCCPQWGVVSIWIRGKCLFSVKAFAQTLS